MEQIIEKSLDRSAIGFNQTVVKKNNKDIGELFKKVTTQDLIKFGLIPEFIGRVPISVSLDGLDKQALMRILREPKNALVKQYQKLVEFDDVELEFEEAAIESIANEAFNKKTGARGLRSILEYTMRDAMYEIPSDETIVKCIITKESVEGTGKPKIIHRGA